MKNGPNPFWKGALHIVMQVNECEGNVGCKF